MIATLFSYVDYRVWLGLFIGIILMIWLFFKDRKPRHHKKRKITKREIIEPISITLSDDTKVDIRQITRKKNNIRDVSVHDDVDYIDFTPKIPEDIIPDRFARTSKREEKCREILERIYQRKFPNIRPSWLKNPETGRLLEIDCYNDDLKIGLECNGIQHYVYPNFTGQSKKEFEAQIRRDNYKVDCCDSNGVYLITVPYNVPDNQLEKYIRRYLPTE